MARMSEDNLFSEIRSESLYDCFDLTGPRVVMPSHRLFGNQNIGWSELSNLQVAGQMPGDYYFVVQRWYARTNIPSETHSFETWTHSTPITFLVGYNRVWGLNLRELLDRRPRTDEERPAKLVDGDPWPVLIPCRQTFTVQVDSMAAGALDKAQRWLRNHPTFQNEGDGVVPRVWVHLEGLRIPSTIPSAKIFGLFTQLERKHREPADEIVRWLTGMSKDSTISDDTKATMSVIADGILEGKHKG